RECSFFVFFYIPFFIGIRNPARATKLVSIRQRKWKTAQIRHSGKKDGGRHGICPSHLVE
ncbi:hypothetical protein ABES20_03940, partial [Geobacillus stearothermophilus]|uniref:hypothetical protein n=1 Tax=Geobacillus stearothermophilus TaxID=1422 RepID=UPI003D1F3D84